MAVPITNDNLTKEQFAGVQKAQTTVNNSPTVMATTETQGVGTPSTIAVDNLSQPVSTFNPPVLNPTDYSSYLQNNRVPITAPVNTPAPTPTVDTSSLKDKIASQYFGLDLKPTAPTPLADTYTKLINEAGLTEKNANIQKYDAELKRLEAEANAIPLQVQQNAVGLGIDPGTAQKDTQSRLRQNTIDRLLATSKYNSAVSDYNSAKENINTILDLTYKDQQAQNQYKKELYDRAYTVATEDQKTQLDALKRANDAQKAKNDEFNASKQAYVKSALDNNDFEIAGLLATAKTPEELANISQSIVPKDNTKYEFKTITSEDAFGNKTERVIALNPKTGAIAGTVNAQGGIEKVIPTQGAGSVSISGVDTSVLSKYPPNLQSSVIAYAQQYAETGKIPTGMPKGVSFGDIQSIAKEIPKADGSLVSVNTGVTPSSITADEQKGITATYDIVKNKLPILLEKFNKISTGVIGGIAGNIYTSQDRQDFLTTRGEILNLLLQARSGATVSPQEYERYSKLVPTTFNQSFFLGSDGEKKINSLKKSLEDTLNSKLTTSGSAIYGYSKIKLSDGKDYTVGQEINVNGLRGRVLPDGTIAEIK